MPTTRKIFDYEENKIYDSAKQYAICKKVTTVSVYNCCNHKITFMKYLDNNGNIKIKEKKNNTVKDHHLFWLDEYEKMSKNEIKNFLHTTKNRRYKKIICITTNEIFDKMKYATEKYNLKDINGISRVCNQKQKYAGKLPDGTPLQWMYYENYIENKQKEAV